MLTVWSGVGEPYGEQVPCDWDALEDTLRALPKGWLFGCASFKGSYRDLAHAERATAIVLDHDGGTIAMLEAASALEGLDALLYQTKRSTEESPRWRAIIRLAQPIDIMTYRHVTGEFAKALQCKPESLNIAQCWFPPNGAATHRTFGAALAPEPFVAPSQVQVAPVADKLSDDELAARVGSDVRLNAWISGDWAHELVYPDLPTKDDGSPDRSAIDMRIVHRLIDMGAGDQQIAKILADRGKLSHRADTTYAQYSTRKARGKQAQDEAEFRAIVGTAVASSSPIIRLGIDLSRVADEAIEALAADKNMYVRDARLTAIIGTGAAPITKQLTHATLRERLSKLAAFTRINKDGEEKATTPPADIVAQVHDRGEWPGLKFLRGITETPIVRPDGSMATQYGYDEQTRYYFADSGVMPALKEHPSRIDAVEALEWLRTPFAEFPFEQEGMAYVPIAAIIALVCRPAVGANVPLFAIDAAAQGSGKSLISNVISVVATGRPSDTITFPREPVELEKLLSSYARSSAHLVMFDNVATAIKGDSLDRVLTCGGRVALRVLGESTIQFCDWSSVIVMNGNQLAITGDTQRRAIRARIVAKADRPGERKGFALNLERWPYEHRASLLGAAITVLRAYLLAGRPKVLEDTRGSFEEFVNTVASAIVWAGGANVLDYWREEQRQDDSRDAHETMLEWCALRWPEGCTAQQLIDDLGADGWLYSNEANALLKELPGFEQRLRDAVQWCSDQHPKASKRQAMAYCLRGWRDVYCSGLRFIGITGRHTTWQVSE